MTVTLEEMVGLAEDQARRVLIGTKEQLMPIWLLIIDGKPEIYATPWENAEQKYLVINAIRDLMRNKGATAYSLLVEAWHSVLPAEEAGKEYTGPPPSERDDRKESVVVTAANRERTLYRSWEIVRAKNGTCKELRVLRGPDDVITSALFDNLLEPGRPN